LPQKVKLHGHLPSRRVFLKVFAHLPVNIGLLVFPETFQDQSMLKSEVPGATKSGEIGPAHRASFRRFGGKAFALKINE